MDQSKAADNGLRVHGNRTHLATSEVTAANNSPSPGIVRRGATAEVTTKVPLSNRWVYRFGKNGNGAMQTSRGVGRRVIERNDNIVRVDFTRPEIAVLPSHSKETSANATARL